jgi:putative membrane protein
MHTRSGSACSTGVKRGASFAAWVEIGTLLLLAAFLAFSYCSGRIRYFLAPSYLWLSAAASVALFVMAAARLKGHLRGAAACGCQASSAKPVRTSVLAGTLLAPVVLVLAINPSQLSPQGARKRQAVPPPRDAELARAMQWVQSAKSVRKKASGEEAALPKNPTIIELLKAAADYHPDDLEGRFVTVLGQCDLISGADAPRFDIYRLVVSCCIADASTVPLEVVRAGNVQLESGGWVRVGGILKFDNAMDPSLPVIHAATISKVSEPSEPYL